MKLSKALDLVAQVKQRSLFPCLLTIRETLDETFEAHFTYPRDCATTKPVEGKTIVEALVNACRREGVEEKS